MTKEDELRLELATECSDLGKEVVKFVLANSRNSAVALSTLLVTSNAIMMMVRDQILSGGGNTDPEAMEEFDEKLTRPLDNINFAVAEMVVSIELGKGESANQS